MQRIPYDSSGSGIWPTFCYDEGVVPLVGGIWLQGTLLQVLPQLGVVSVVRCKVETGAPTKHDGLCQGVQVEHRTNCGAGGSGVGWEGS